MDGWVGGWMDEWVDGWMGVWMDEWVDGWVDVGTEGEQEERTEIH